MQNPALLAINIFIGGRKKYLFLQKNLMVHKGKRMDAGLYEFLISEYAN
jgi:hypothetical protein